MIFNSFLINEFLFLPNRNQMVLLFPVKEYNTEVKGTIQPILYSSISIRWQIFCMLAITTYALQLQAKNAQQKF